MSGQMMIAEKDVLFNSMSAMIAREYVASDTAPTFFGIYRVPISGAGTTNIVVDRNIEVIDAWCVKTGAIGGVGDTVTVQNAGNAITDAISLNAADTSVARAAQINDANYQIAAGGQLRVVVAEVTDSNCICYIRVAFYT
tara:strand:+ start:2443 stop:2862 length:420 start_codon:yes stop_codon:yes gene_type:complete